MLHANALRVIGQTLETARVTTFKLEKHDDPYQLWIAERLFSFSPGDISRLDAKAQKRRRNHSTPTRPPASLSQQLRALGGYLDRIHVSSFSVEWTAGSALLEYERVSGERNLKTFTAEELQQLGLHRTLQRSSPYLFPRLDGDF